MDKQWLVEMFREAGLEPEPCIRAADVALSRLLSRTRPVGGIPRRTDGSILRHLVRDPLVSVARIAGHGDAGLPLMDEEEHRLSVSAFADVLDEAGMDPVVAMAFSKVVVEAYAPEDLYRPLWHGLGHAGPLDWDALRRADWTPLRRAFPELGLPFDERATAVTPTARRG